MTPPSTGLRAHAHPDENDDSGPPNRTKIAGALAVLACAAMCSLPLLIGAGILTGAGAALLERTLLAFAALAAVVALGTWWLYRRRATSAASGCEDENCTC